VWRTHIIGGGIAKHVVQSVCFGNILGRLADDDDKLDLVVREVVFYRLSGFGDDDV
jgi:hypothetical protein